MRLWSLTSFACTRTLTHSGGSPVLSVRLLGGVLVSGGQDKHLRLWSLANNGECIGTYEHGAIVRGLHVSPLGFIASAGGSMNTRSSLRIWRPPTLMESIGVS